MKIRALLPVLVLALAAGCSKKTPPAPSNKVKSYMLDKAPKLDKPLDIDFDGKVKLIGYKGPTAPLKPNQKVKVTLYWQVKEKLGGDWKLLTHLVDGSGERLVDLGNKSPIRAATGGKPAFPPSAWVPGKVYVDELSIKMPKSVKTDKVRLLAGLTSGDIRMPVAKGNKDSENRALVAEFAMASGSSGDEPKKAPDVPDLALEKVEGPLKIKVDGKLDEEAWKKAAVIGPFVDVKTGEPNTTFPVNAKARMMWNEQALHVGIEVEDKDVIGGFPADAKDPHLWTKDTIELMIDPDWDKKNTDYYEIQINPQNLVFDSQWDDYNVPKGGPEGPFGHQDWSANLKSAVVVNGTIDKSDDVDQGYVVEASIPWASFSKARKTPPELGDAWRINLYAMQANSGVAWSPILGRGNFHRSSRFARVRFVKKGWIAAQAAASASASAGPSASGLPKVAPRASGAVAVPTPPKPAASK